MTIFISLLYFIIHFSILEGSSTKWVDFTLTTIENWSTTVGSAYSISTNTYPKPLFHLMGVFRSYSSSDLSTTGTTYTAATDAPYAIQTNSCSPNCCSTDNCKYYVNSNAMYLTTDQDYLISFGGIQNTTSSSLTSVETCVNSTTISTCLSLAIKDSYIIDPIAQKAYLLDISSTVNPTAMFGHSGAVVSITDTSVYKKYLYVYGGASSSCTDNVCNKMWR